MKSAAIVLASALLFAFLLFGCAQSAPEPEEQSPAQIVPAEPESPPSAPEEEAPAPVEEEAPPAAPLLPEEGCLVQFQKDSSNIYYVMVKTSQPGTVAVTCPNGAGAVQQGELYFCAQLDVPEPAIAYINGKECGRALFSEADLASIKPAGKQSCSIVSQPSRITAGQTASLTVKAYVTEERSNLSYLCGTTEINERASGFVDTGKLCKFDKPGTVELYVKVNGEVCATRTLTVFAKAKDCSVYGSKYRFENGEHVYSATVTGRGYSGNDQLRYTCFGMPNGLSVRNIPNSTDFATTIECRSASEKLSASVPVTLGGDACGEMVPPAQ